MMRDFKTQYMNRWNPVNGYDNPIYIYIYKILCAKLDSNKKSIM